MNERLHEIRFVFQIKFELLEKPSWKAVAMPKKPISPSLFAHALSDYCAKNKKLTLKYLAFAIKTTTGKAFSLQTISNWLRGVSHPDSSRDYDVLVAVVRTLHDEGVLTTVEEANQLLAKGNYRPLNEDEIDSLHFPRPVTPSFLHLSYSDAVGRFVEFNEQLNVDDSKAFFAMTDGRDAILDEIEAWLDPNSPSSFAFLCLQGMGGSGKTAIAREIAKRLVAIDTNKNPWNGAVWITARSEPSIQNMPLFTTVNEILRRILEELAGKDPETSASQDQIMIRLKQYLHFGRYFVVIDNLEYIEDQQYLVQSLSSIVGNLSRILITSRVAIDDHRRVIVIPINGLTRGECRNLLTARTTYKPRSTITDNDLDQVYQFTQGLPLMLWHVVSLKTEYPDRTWTNLLTMSQDFSHAKTEEKYQYVFRLQWDALLDDEARVLWLEISELNTIGADERWLRSVTGINAHRFETLLQHLIEHFLIDVRRSTNTAYLLHSLTRAYLDYQLHQASSASHRYREQLSDRLKRITTLYLHQPHLVEKNLDQLFVTIKRGLTHAPAVRAALDLIVELHPRPIQAGFVHDWMSLMEMARDVAARHHYPHAIFYALSCEILHELSEFEHMAATAAQALQLADEEGDDIAYFRAATVLISYWDANKNIDEAIRLYQTINDRRELSIADQPTSIRLVEALLFADEQWVDFLRRHGRIEAALSAASALKERIATAPQLSERAKAIPYRILGLVYWTHGAYDQAIAEYEHALELDAESNSLMVATLLGNLGLSYWSRGKLPEAIEVTRRAREIAIRQHLSLRQAKIAGNMGLFYLWQGRFDEALQELDDQRIQAENLAHVGEVMRAHGNMGVALFHSSSSDYKAIQLLLEDARNARKQQLHEGFANACLYLGLLYRRVGAPTRGWRFITLAVGIAIELNIEPLQVIILRAAAEYAPPDVKKIILEYALALARTNQRLFDEAACLLSLAPLQSTSRKQRTVWNAAVVILKRMEADHWVQTYTLADPPFLPALT